MAETSEKYIESIGRRKEAIARVRLFEAKKNSFVINEDTTLEEYFPVKAHQDIAHDALSLSGGVTFKVSTHIKGGGIASQAEALRLGIARALVKMNAELRDDLKKQGYLKRDPRKKERKKPGLKKARKAPQWSKR
jgi:small subunit ribosomal protein S9